MAKIIVMDWQRGKIPYFVAPPFVGDKQGMDVEQPKENNIQEENIESNENKNKEVYIYLLIKKLVWS